MHPAVFVVDDDIIIREALTALLENEGLNVQACASADDFLASYQPGSPGCLLLDIDMPGIDGLELQDYLLNSGFNIPIIFLTGQANVPKTIQAFRNKAFDFLEKPASDKVLLEAIHRAFAKQVADRAEQEKRVSVEERIQRLTPREKDVFVLVVSGYSNKQIGEELDISSRTVEGHRRRVYEKMEAESFAILIEMAYVAGLLDADNKI
ncbi:MAG: response regulator [Pseudomonadota bacterium]